MSVVSERVAAPPPSPALADAVAGMKPVRTRAPGRSLALAGVLSLACGAVPLALYRLRADLAYLPLGWVVGVGLLWFAGFALPLGAALVPRRGQVLPDGNRALRLGGAAAIVLTVISLVLPGDVPGHTLATDGAALLPSVWHCLAFVMRMWLGPFAIALVALWRVVDVGSWRVGAAVGAAAGALAGLVLHVLCPYGGALHVALAHGGGVVLCALMGALIAPRILER